MYRSSEYDVLIEMVHGLVQPRGIVQRSHVVRQWKLAVFASISEWNRLQLVVMSLDGR